VEEKKRKKHYTASEALIKAEAWCAYQERCQQEVRDKLYEWGLHEREVEFIISELISKNFVNEERFAVAFAGGKFRMKKWGRVKLRVELKRRKISDYCIRKGMEEISDRDYRRTLNDLATKKIREVKEKNVMKKKYKDMKAISCGKQWRISFRTNDHFSRPASFITAIAFVLVSFES
jgi:regulatory protein